MPGWRVTPDGRLEYGDYDEDGRWHPATGDVPRLSPEEQRRERERQASDPFLPMFGSEEAEGLFGESAGLSRELAELARALFEEGRGISREIRGLSREFLGESTPLRKALIGAIEQKLGLPVSTGVAPASAALFGPSAPEREALEGQYAAATRNIAQNTPRGGLQQRLLAEVPMERARAIGAQEADATNQALGLGLDVGLNTRQLALGGLSSSAAALTGTGGVALSGLGAAASGLGAAGSGYAGLAAQRQQATLFREGLAAAERQQAAAAESAKKGGAGQGIGSAAGPILSTLLSSYLK